MTINPTANLDLSVGYYLQIAATAIDDASGNSYSGINDATTLNFTAADIIAPTLSFAPAEQCNGDWFGCSIALTLMKTLKWIRKHNII